MTLSAADAAALTTQYARERRAKDAFFQTDRESPLAEEYRRDFRGLRYYDVDLRYRFRGPIHRLSSPEKFQIMATSGDLRDALHYGSFSFSLDGIKVYTLQVYKMLEPGVDAKELFLPFMDSEAGRETYGAGRYLDIKEAPEGVYTIDFNAASNPYCAYGRAFSCPLTPRENRLKIPIVAGEKSFTHP